LRLVRQASPPSPLRETVYWALALAILFAGAQIEFLRSSLYEEVRLWAGALAAIFVYLAVRGILADVFTRSALSGMAAIAGLALLTRGSVAIGLYPPWACCCSSACAGTFRREAGARRPDDLSWRACCRASCGRRWCFRNTRIA
jgi:hypothetical protein